MHSMLLCNTGHFYARAIRITQIMPKLKLLKTDTVTGLIFGENLPQNTCIFTPDHNVNLLTSVLYGCSLVVIVTSSFCDYLTC